MIHREICTGTEVCTDCLAPLAITPTAYGARASCHCPGIRWTVISRVRARDGAILDDQAAWWVAEHERPRVTSRPDPAPE